MNTKKHGLFFALSFPKDDNASSPQVTFIRLAKTRSNARQPGSARGKLWMAPDFDAPMEDFFDFLETTEEDL